MAWFHGVAGRWWMTAKAWYLMRTSGSNPGKPPLKSAISTFLATRKIISPQSPNTNSFPANPACCPAGHWVTGGAVIGLIQTRNCSISWRSSSNIKFHSRCVLWTWIGILPRPVTPAQVGLVTPGTGNFSLNRPNLSRNYIVAG